MVDGTDRLVAFAFGKQSDGAIESIESILAARDLHLFLTLGTIPAHSQTENTKIETWIGGGKEQLTKAMYKDKFYKFLSRIWFGG